VGGRHVNLYGKVCLTVSRSGGRETGEQVQAPHRDSRKIIHDFTYTAQVHPLGLSRASQKMVNRDWFVPWSQTELTQMFSDRSRNKMARGVRDQGRERETHERTLSQSPELSSELGHTVASQTDCLKRRGEAVVQSCLTLVSGRCRALVTLPQRDSSFSSLVQDRKRAKERQGVTFKAYTFKASPSTPHGSKGKRCAVVARDLRERHFCSGGGQRSQQSQTVCDLCVCIYRYIYSSCLHLLLFWPCLPGGNRRPGCVTFRSVSPQMGRERRGATTPRQLLGQAGAWRFARPCPMLPALGV
jgi:hypothetical protein